MKKIISLVLIAATLVLALASLASCGSEGTLVVAMSPDFAPMEFYDTSKSGNDAIVGFDVLLAYYLGKELNMEVVIKPMDFYACMAAVQANSADIAISGFSWTKDRAENFLITDYYVAGENENEQVVITTEAKANTFKSADDFSGLKVAAQGGSLQQLLVEEQLVTKGATLVKYDSTTDCLTALKNGQVDGFAVAKGNGDAFISENKDEVNFSGFEFEVEDKYKNNVCLVNKNNQELCDKVNTALAKAMKDGLYDTWYAAAKAYEGITTIDQNGYDENGKKVLEWDEDGNAVIDGEIVKVDATDEDAKMKVAYETILKKLK